MASGNAALRVFARKTMPDQITSFTFFVNNVGTLQCQLATLSSVFFPSTLHLDWIDNQIVLTGWVKSPFFFFLLSFFLSSAHELCDLRPCAIKRVRKHSISHISLSLWFSKGGEGVVVRALKLPFLVSRISLHAQSGLHLFLSVSKCIHPSRMRAESGENFFFYTHAKSQIFLNLKIVSVL